MDFQGPQAADLVNVYSLNLGFLGELKRSGNDHSGLARGSEPIAGKLMALTPARAARLAQCPFLIFSLAEAEDSRWASLFGEEEQADLLDEFLRPPESTTRLVAASLGFLWELARRNPYAARLTTGASIGWCDALADCSPLRLVSFATSEAEILSPRLASNTFFWEKMLGAGTSKEKETRDAAQLCALQTILTQPRSERYGRLAAAACSMPRPAMRVAERARQDAGHK
jgi:hypothetical protein